MSHRASRTAAGDEAMGWIDVHHHLYPPDLLARLSPADRAITPAAADLSLEAVLASWDAAGLGRAIVSFVQPRFCEPEPLAQRRLAANCNDYFSTLARRAPDRISFFATLPPLHDTEGALAELERAYALPGCVGACLLTSYDDKWIGDAAFAPVLAQLDARRAVAFLHPDVAECCRGGPSPAIEYPLDTARAATQLWASGALERWPGIRFILCHGGGALPMVAARLDRMGRVTADGGRAHDASAQFSRFYFDTANTSPGALDATLALAGDRQLLFGTDAPFVGVEAQIQSLSQSAFDEARLAAVARGNACALFGFDP